MSTELEDMCEDDIDFSEHYDTNTGEEIDPKLAKQAIQKEIDKLKEFNVYGYIDRKAALEDPKGKFIKVKWVKTIKSDRTVRFRLVAMEFNTMERRDDLFAGTPPLWTMRAIISDAATSLKKGLLILDVGNAFFYGKARRKLYIELPPEDPQSTRGKVGILKRALYGTRDAPQIWQDHVNDVLRGLGYRASDYHPTLLYHGQKGVKVSIHVDGFLCSGELNELVRLKRELENQFTIEGQMLGEGLDKKGTYLGREIRRTPYGYEVEGNRKYVDTLLREWNMESCSIAPTPMIKENIAVNNMQIAPS